jgi:redox-sensitive bicupin YhaK (pirin superfamily)
MLKTKNTMDIKMFPHEQQIRGSFDNGRITERKPVGFPQDGLKPAHLGPLFYWAWASSKGYGIIGLHPHQAFEIMSYALEGEIGHFDTLGNKSRISAGGAQIIQAGSGISHQEETVGKQTEFFQIWFQPDLKQAVNRPPTYREVKNDDFPVEQLDGFSVKTVLGEGSPVRLVTESSMQDVNLQPDRFYLRPMLPGKTLAIVAISGNGFILSPDSTEGQDFRAQDFAVIHTPEGGTLTIQADKAQVLRMAIIEVPAKVDYPLYGEG